MELPVRAVHAALERSIDRALLLDPVIPRKALRRSLGRIVISVARQIR
jgi:hypothetical protein